MIKAIIVDDEPAAAQSLQTDLQWYGEDIVELAGTAHNIQDGAALIAEHSPQLVFLDIHIGTDNGFMLLEKIQRNHPGVEIIFTTGDKDFALNAIRKNAFDYLLKPIDPDLLREALLRLQGHLQSEVEVAPGVSGLEDTIALPMQDQVLICKLSDLIRCESERNYTRFYLNNRNPVLVSRTLGHFEETLQQGFFRSHKSHIVNLAFLESYIRQDGGYLLMKDGSQVPLSRHKRGVLFEILGI